jgi:superfamily II DNA or RNA helicase
MDKDTEKRVVISTWQSLYNQPEEYFKDFGAIFGDEAHLYQAKSLTKIMSNLKTCDVRVGTTGTLTDSQTHRLVIEGLFGGVFRATSARTLMNEKLLSDISIDCINLQYTDKDVQETKRMKYPEEMKWLIGNEKRNKFISNLANNLKSNTLILFNYVELHGKPLYNMIQEESSNRKVFFIHGGTDAEQRENIRKIVDSEKNAILVASYGTCSTGVNIKNIHNIIFASPSKSVIRILQSIGRGLRITKTKDTMKLYDISDDLRYKKWTNHTMRHLDERLKIYNREKFNFKLIRIRLGDEINV